MTVPATPPLPCIQSIAAPAQIIDCSVGYGNEQCAGGSHLAAYAYLKDVKGLQSAASYPTSRNLTGPCQYVASQACAAVFLRGHSDVRTLLAAVPYDHACVL